MPALPATPPSRRGLDSTYTVSPRNTMRFRVDQSRIGRTQIHAGAHVRVGEVLNAFFTPNHSLPF